MLVIKSFEPNRLVLIDESDNEYVLDAVGPDQFDLALIESILRY